MRPGANPRMGPGAKPLTSSCLTIVANVTIASDLALLGAPRSFAFNVFFITCNIKI